MSNEHYIRKNAIIYERYKDNFDRIPLGELEQFRQEVMDAYKAVANLVDVRYQKSNPYKDVGELTKDIKEGIMLISNDNNASTLLPGTLNLMFRAIHDYLHYTLQAPFTAAGEIKVFHLQKKLHSSE